MDRESWMCRRCGFRSIPGLPRPTLCPEDGQPLVPEELLARSPDDPLLGTLVEGRFAVIGRLASSLPGRGYVALALPAGTRVSLHAAFPEELGGSVDLARFFRIADSLRQLDHPGLVSLLHFGTLPEAGGYLVTEDCDRPTLHQWLKERRALGWPGALDLLRPVLEALVRPHERGVAYGTVLPSRLLLDPASPPEAGGTARLVGLGFEQLFLPAAAARGKAPSRVHLDATLASYMSPEEIRLEALGPTSDVYSLGCVLHHLITGAPPYPGQRPLEIISAHLAGRYPREVVQAAASPAVAALLAAACASQPAQRHASAAQLLAALLAVDRAGEAPAAQRHPALDEPSADATLALPALRSARPGRAAPPEETVALPPRPARAPAEVLATVVQPPLAVARGSAPEETVALPPRPARAPAEVLATVVQPPLVVARGSAPEETVALSPRPARAPAEVLATVVQPPLAVSRGSAPEETVALPPRGAGASAEALPTVALAALPALPPPSPTEGRETVLLEALDPHLVLLQEEYQRKQDEAVREREAAARAAEEEQQAAARRLRHQRLLSRLIVGTALSLLLVGGGTWLYLELRHPDVPLYTLDPELQAFLAGMPDGAAATPLPRQQLPAQLRAATREEIGRLVEESWDALLESQRSIEIAKTHLHSAHGRAQARVAAGELLAMAGELRQLRREAIALKVALPQADEEQLGGIAANGRRLAGNLIESRARVQAALDELLETLPKATAAALRVPSTTARPRPPAEDEPTDGPRPAPRPTPRADAPDEPGPALLAAAPAPDMVTSGEAAEPGRPAAGSPPASELATLSDEELLVRVLGPQEQGPIAVTGLSCACDADRLARSVGAGSKGESLSACEVQACARVPAGSQRYSEVALNLSRYHFFRQQHKEQLAALQRATNTGKYSHDPAVLFQLIAVAARLGSFQIALEAKDRFLYLKELLPPAERQRKVPEAYRILGLAFEARYHRVAEDDPDRADPALLHRAVDYLERYSDAANRPAAMETKLAELRRLQQEIAAGP